MAATPTPFGQTTLSDAAYARGIDLNVFFAPDASYCSPSMSWLRNTFPAAWDLEAKRLIRKYGAEDSDCDDFAQMCAGFAKVLARFTLGERGLPNRYSFAAGEFWYQIGGDPAKGHAINVFAVVANGKPGLVFFEPQPPSHLVTLTTVEIESCGLCKF